jgi:hypothetical protein
MSAEYTYTWRNFNHEITTNIGDWDEIYDVQEWCRQQFNDGWALAQKDSGESWYFINEGDAVLFSLRWIK